jgi:hypothetical protein
MRLSPWFWLDTVGTPAADTHSDGQNPGMPVGGEELLNKVGRQ